jgi:FkbM family methyltransferase
LKRFIKERISDLSRSLGFEIKRYNAISSKFSRVHNFFLNNKFDTVLDVGAYDGTYAKFLRKLGFDGRIISFEPLSEVYPKIVKRSKKDMNWIVAPRMALGAEDGVKSINIAANYVSSSILDMENSHMVGAPDSIFIGSEMIRVFKLDNVAGNYIEPQNIVFLKLDVQGYELEVLEGAHKTLPFIKGLQIEISIDPLYKNQLLFKEMLNYVEQLGYELWDIQPCFRDKLTGKLLQFDGIFVRNF